MSPLRFLAFLCLPAAASMAQTPLPGLRVEAHDAGSILYVKNTGRQPLTAFLIELVDYPGSSFTYLQDDVDQPLAPGAEGRIPVSNMLPGAVPDSVKIQAAIFADGSTAGAPAKVASLIERRRAVFETLRDVIRRLSAAADRSAAVADLRRLADSVPPARRPAITRALSLLERQSLEETLAVLRRAESSLAASKPPL